jgi:hypothetical protein
MDTTIDFRNLAPADVAALFVNDIAYVKPVIDDGHAAFAIHAADGTQLAIVEDRDLAFATVVQNDLQPVSVH